MKTFKTYLREEAEVLNELSKKKLAKYYGAARFDRARSVAKGAVNLKRGKHGKAIDDFAKAGKRTVGMGKAKTRYKYGYEYIKGKPANKHKTLKSKVKDKVIDAKNKISKVVKRGK